MKITDPSLWPSDFGPLRCQELDEQQANGGMLLLTPDGSVVGELARLCEHHGSLAFDQAQDFRVSLAACWSLDVIGEDSRLVETHVLCPLGESDDEPARITRERAAWASLIVLWTATSRAVQRG